MLLLNSLLELDFCDSKMAIFLFLILVSLGFHGGSLAKNLPASRSPATAWAALGSRFEPRGWAPSRCRGSQSSRGLLGVFVTCFTESVPSCLSVQQAPDK